MLMLGNILGQYRPHDPADIVPTLCVGMQLWTLLRPSSRRRASLDALPRGAWERWGSNK